MKAPESLYGQKGKCPKCGEVIDIPAEAPVDPEPEETEADNAPYTDHNSVTLTGDHAALCQSCGSELAVNAIFCRKCGEKVVVASEHIPSPQSESPVIAEDDDQQQLMPTQAVIDDDNDKPGPVPSFQELEAQDRLVRPPEYPEKFNPHGFCWPAFWFGFLWYFIKGITYKGLVLFVITLMLFFFTHGIGALIMPLVFGFLGYRDYSRFYSVRKQFWW